MKPKLKWSAKTPASGWWFQRWKSEPHHWFIVEVVGGAVVSGPNTVEIETAQLKGAEWAGPIELPKSLQ